MHGRVCLSMVQLSEIAERAKAALPLENSLARELAELFQGKALASFL